ncbi:TPA: hypothetical protein ACFNMU_001744, partial [Neisseria lactamica]
TGEQAAADTESLFFLISQCYNYSRNEIIARAESLFFLISQCYNDMADYITQNTESLFFLISQCYNTSTGNPYSIRVSRFICSEKMGLK